MYIIFYFGQIGYLEYVYRVIKYLISQQLFQCKMVESRFSDPIQIDLTNQSSKMFFLK